MTYIMVQRKLLPPKDKIEKHILKSFSGFFANYFFRFEEHRWARYRKYNGD